MYGPLEASSVREVIRSSQEAQRATVEMKLRALAKKGGAASGATRTKGL
jgi:hypothetical protein